MIQTFTVNAFAQGPFTGNTCVVCIFDQWPDDGTLLKMAQTHLVAETAFICHTPGSPPELRWFTTSTEVDFCGYGTLSAGYVYLKHLSPGENSITFKTRNYGDLPVTRKTDRFEIEVPIKKPIAEIFDDAVYGSLSGPRPQKMMTSERGDLLIAYSNESEVRSITPDYVRLMSREHAGHKNYFGYILTAPGQDGTDFVYRYFSPRMPGVWEDPVNGASLSVSGPYWSTKLNKKILKGSAVSARGGWVFCDLSKPDKIYIGGYVDLYATGQIPNSSLSL